MSEPRKKRVNLSLTDKEDQALLFCSTLMNLSPSTTARVLLAQAMRSQIIKDWDFLKGMGHSDMDISKVMF